MILSAWFQIIRPRQWLKNLLIFFPPFLGGEILHKGIALKGILPFLSFCLAASAVYIFNDIVDAEKDACHPQKKNRPIPAGLISKKTAFLWGMILLTATIFSGYRVSSTFLLIVSAYLVITSLYTLVLKEKPIIDLFCISAGFLLRLEAGGIAFGVPISEWLFLSVFLLSIFLSTGKRYSEKQTLGCVAGDHRAALREYPAGFLEGAMLMSGASVLVTYSIYTTVHSGLIYSVPLCCFGLLRYIFLVMAGDGGDPTNALLRDPLLFLVSLSWLLFVGSTLYLAR